MYHPSTASVDLNALNVAINMASDSIPSTVYRDMVTSITKSMDISAAEKKDFALCCGIVAEFPDC